MGEERPGQIEQLMNCVRARAGAKLDGLGRSFNCIPSSTGSNCRDIMPRRDLTPRCDFTPRREFTPSLGFTPSQAFTPSQGFTPRHEFTPSREVTPRRSTMTCTPSNPVLSCQSSDIRRHRTVPVLPLHRACSQSALPQSALPQQMAPPLQWQALARTLTDPHSVCLAQAYATQ